MIKNIKIKLIALSLCTAFLPMQAMHLQSDSARAEFIELICYGNDIVKKEMVEISKTLAPLIISTQMHSMLQKMSWYPTSTITKWITDICIPLCITSGATLLLPQPKTTTAIEILTRKNIPNFMFQIIQEPESRQQISTYQKLGNNILPSYVHHALTGISACQFIYTIIKPQLKK